MDAPLRVLIIEDSEDDAWLLIRELQRGGYSTETHRVETAEALRDALAKPWDLIISDYSMPRFNPMMALSILSEMRLDIPFIVVSGSVSEETILEAMRAGAADYLMKNNLTRLNLAVARELREAELRVENRSLEAQFRQAQKMEAVGRLAGGVAHDFNNLLTVITGYSELLLMKSNLDPGDRSALQEIKLAGERGGGLTHQLLAFSRRQALAPKRIELNDLLIGVEKMLRRLIGEDIDLVTDARAESPVVLIDPGQLEQVIMNLVVNSRDAMPDGGRLTISTSDTVLEPAFTRSHPGMEPGPYVQLSIIDNGTGLTPEILSHIFEPFFTTKPPGKGTGLGMATAYGIVKQSGGAIVVQSKPAEGTTVRIFLPRAAPLDKLEQDGGDSAEDSLQGTASILLVEDEMRVRKVVAQILQGYGYEVIECSRGDEAVAAAFAHPDEIDLVLTDVIMPEMSGPEMVRQLRVFIPKVRVLFMSGYTDEAMVHYNLRQTGEAYLQKPFLPATLGAKVREVLAGRGRTSSAH